MSMIFVLSKNWSHSKNMQASEKFQLRAGQDFPSSGSNSKERSSSSVDVEELHFPFEWTYVSGKRIKQT
ncbi:MAG: hypothetical protein ACMUHX_07400, partial [bacterium]